MRKFLLGLFIVGCVISPSIARASEIDYAYYQCRYLDYSTYPPQYKLRDNIGGGACEQYDQVIISGAVSTWFSGETAILDVTSWDYGNPGNSEQTLRRPLVLPLRTEGESRSFRFALRPWLQPSPDSDYKTLVVEITPMSNYRGGVGQPYEIYVSFHIPHPAVLNLSANDTLVGTNIAAGRSGVTAARINMSANDVYDIRTNSLVFYANGLACTFGTVSLYDAGQFLAQSTIDTTNCYVSFDGLDIVTSKNATSTIELRVNIPNDATDGGTFSLDMAGIGTSSYSVTGFPVYGPNFYVVNLL